MDDAELQRAKDVLFSPLGKRAVRAAVGPGPDLLSGSVTQIQHRPGKHLRMMWKLETSEGRKNVVAVAQDKALRGVTQIVIDGIAFSVFLHLDDPSLPGLRMTHDRALMSGLLGAKVVGIRQIRYQMMQRAVVRLDLSRGRRAWCKVLRPSRSEQAIALHRAYGALDRVPSVLHGAPAHGLLVLDDAPGRDLRELVRKTPRKLPPPQAVLDLSDELSTVQVDTAVKRPAPFDAVSGNAGRLRVIGAVDPARIDAIVATIATREAASTPPVAIHGDLHAAQVLGAAGRLTAVIDLDDAGLGHQVDDLSRFVAHLRCTVDGADESSPVARHWADELEVLVIGRYGERAVHDRIAAAMVGLAIGPYRVRRVGWEERLEARVEVSEALLGL